MSESTAALSSDAKRIAASIPDALGIVRGSGRQIAEVVAFIARAFGPERIVLFGSRAYGTPHAGSDVDVMVIMETPLTPSQQAWAIREAMGQRSSCRVDVHVRTPEQITVGLAEGDFFIEDVMLQGFTLYERGSMGSAANGGGQPTGGEARAWPDLKSSTREWLRKADGNARSAYQLLEADNPNFDDVCILAQQCVEKSLKALLEEREVVYPRTHHVKTLVALARPFIPAFAVEETRLRERSACGVDARYPGLDIDRPWAERAVQTMAMIQGQVRGALARADREPEKRD